MISSLKYEKYVWYRYVRSIDGMSWSYIGWGRIGRSEDIFGEVSVRITYHVSEFAMKYGNSRFSC